MSVNKPIFKNGIIREYTFENVPVSLDANRIFEIKNKIKSFIDISGFYASELWETKHTNNPEWMIAICPFHDDANPSFSFNLKSGGFYCFGCKAKGSLFDFYMMKHSLCFLDALENLAQISGVFME